MTRKRVCQVSLSPIARDGRVLRAISALEKEGYEVAPVGYGFGLEAREMALAEKLKTAFVQLPARVLPAKAASFLYWLRGENRRLHQLILRQKPQIIHAHDWSSLPAASYAAQKLGARLVYESHEFATVQLMHKRLWRMVYPAYISTLEGRHIGKADRVITVCDSIARALETLYALPERPLTIRSVPKYRKVDFRAPDPGRIMVHYHGIFTQGRGLDQLVKSVALWPEPFHLRLTGWGQPGSFEQELRALATTMGLGDRISFCPGVLPHEIVEHASEADIGICFWDGATPQRNFALPNKAFEYTTAGLMSIVGPGVELGKLVKENQLGLTLADVRPQTLADALARLSPETIAMHKRKALEAAKVLCWENESEKLLEVYRTFDT